MASGIKIDDGDDTEIVVIDADEPGGEPVFDADGTSRQETGDGGILIDFAPATARKPDNPLKFYDNLVEEIGEIDLSYIAEDILRGIEADEESREEWLENRAKGIQMLALKLEEPTTDTAQAGGGVTMSTVRHPLLQEAVIRFQSNASAELLPTSGPVKVRDDAPPKPDAKEMAGMLAALLGSTALGNMGGFAAAPGAAPLLPPPSLGIGGNGGPPLEDAGPDGSTLAEALEKDLNHYLTAIDKGYRTDTDRMLFWVGFGGCGFKKVYHCPIKRMPLSRSVDPKDLIINHAANDLDDCGRITHKIRMRRAQLVRMQIAGVYRKIPGMTTREPAPETPNLVESELAEIKGISTAPRRPEDALYTIYECYCELDLKGFEHTDKQGKMTGLELPYRVTIEKESREILEIRRNWKEDDENCLAKQTFVKYPFIPADGFYEIGLLNILGNPTKALTAAWRIMLDNGMFANFPGFLYGSTAGRQQTNEFRIAPGSGMMIQTGGLDIGKVVMPLPYKDVGPGFVQLAAQVETSSQRTGGTAELQVGEGKQDAPVGTTLALIEQATKMLAAVHVRLHAAQSEEFQLLKERLKEDPAAFIRVIRKPSRAWIAAEFVAALDDCDIVPAADPNTPSHMHRIMKAVAVKQMQATNPGLYDGKAVDEMILKMIGIEDPERLFAPPPPPGQPAGAPGIPADPNKMAAIQQKQASAQMKAQTEMQQAQHKIQLALAQAEARQKEIEAENANRSEDRASRERVAAARERTEAIRTAGQMLEKGIDPGEALSHAVNLVAPMGTDPDAPAGTPPLGGSPAPAAPTPFGGPLPSANAHSGALAKPPVGWPRPI